jgi:hypothetical protein
MAKGLEILAAVKAKTGKARLLCLNCTTNSVAIFAQKEYVFW